MSKVKSEFLALFGMLIVFGLLVGLFVYDGAARSSREIILVAQRPLNGNWSQREVRIMLGDAVRLRLTSADVTHGFFVPDLGIDAGSITPGRFVTIEFTADRPGVYKFYCNIFCSPEHGMMSGRIIVE